MNTDRHTTTLKSLHSAEEHHHNIEAVTSIFSATLNILQKKKKKLDMGSQHTLKSYYICLLTLI